MIKQKLPVFVVVIAGLLGSYLAFDSLSAKNASDTAAADEPASSEGDSTADAKVSHDYSEFKGKIAKRYEDSVEWWAPKKRP